MPKATQDVQKVRPPVLGRSGGARSSKECKSPSPPLSKGEWGISARGAYTRVREHDKGPRTQLAEFFNILLFQFSHPTVHDPCLKVLGQFSGDGMDFYLIIIHFH